MKIFVYPLGQLQTNCHILVQDDECLIVDPADSADFLLETIQRQRLSLVGMIATHGHFDHILAAGEIQLSFKVPLYLQEKDMFLVKRVVETAQHFLEGKQHNIKPSIFKNIEEGPLKIGAFSFEVLQTPGHTPGGCSFYFKEDAAVFCGDTLFANEIGETRHKYSSALELAKSVNRLISLPEETTVYPGHGEEVHVQELKAQR